MLDSLWDSLKHLNTHVSASRIMHHRFSDSFVDCFVMIRAGGVASDLDGRFSIGRVHQCRLTIRNPSMVTDRILMWWITMNITTSCCALVRFGTDELYSINLIELSDNCCNSKLNTHRSSEMMQSESIMATLITSQSY
jgi:hypothetical protein